MNIVTALIKINQPLPIQAVKNSPSAKLYKSLSDEFFISLKVNPRGIIKY